MAELIVEASNAGTLDKRHADYTTAHDAASSTYVDNGQSGFSVGQGYGSVVVPPGNPGFVIFRAGLVFDISSIPAGSTITAVTLSLIPWLDESDTDFNIVIVSGADLADTLVETDYGDLLDDIVSRGVLSTLTMVLGDYNNIVLNSSGIADVQSAIGNNARFGIRSSRDISSTTPKLNGANAWEYVGIYGIEVGYKPKLTITYSGFVPRVYIF